MNFAVVGDKNSQLEYTTYQVVSFNEKSKSWKAISVQKTYAFKALQPGEMKFDSETLLPKNFIITDNKKEIITFLFEKF